MKGLSTIKLGELSLPNVPAHLLPLTFHGGIPEDFADAWDAVKDCAAAFFEDAAGVRDQESFAAWARAHIADAFIIRDADSRIVCVSYIVREGRKGACYHGFCRPGFRSPSITDPGSKAAIRYFMTAHWLERLSVLGCWRNRVARLYAKRQGFTIEGRLRKFAQFGGEYVDCYYGSILRGEV